MVAYSFQRRFVPAIAEGRKTQTIRGQRKRHARPGERLQLYSGMRTRGCQKIIPDPVCAGVWPIDLIFDDVANHKPVYCIERPEGDQVGIVDDAFAQADGFEDLAAFVDFWHAQKLAAGLEREACCFSGVLIVWVAK